MIFWYGCGFESPDPYLGFADPDADPDAVLVPDADAVPYQNLQRHLRMKKNFILNRIEYIKILFCNHDFGTLNTFMRKGKDPDLDPDPNL